MTSVTFKADEQLIEQIKAVAISLANNAQKRLFINDDAYIYELNKRADDALSGAGFVDEKEALMAIDSIKSGVYADKI
ncbi:hypothetical protein [Campylobacter mucosalis]|uniref:hypothetical protein n=1 Tax=Campylobacter mucosalis TaxID=202 RepID=UPI001470297C|nr:hypothetical protein [Campylobacter mucosalis]